MILLASKAEDMFSPMIWESMWNARSRIAEMMAASSLVVLIARLGGRIADTWSQEKGERALRKRGVAAEVHVVATLPFSWEHSWRQYWARTALRTLQQDTSRVHVVEIEERIGTVTAAARQRATAGAEQLLAAQAVRAALGSSARRLQRSAVA